MAPCTVLYALVVLLSVGLVATVVLGVIDELDPGEEDFARLALFLHLMSGDTHDH
ncbi:hypothetical protein [Streptomyces sp. NBC_01262]|uniref:hypothetical protein n=1 Tax=Streptomyces sp. NBC_01262 TaxID=2903803 RepID=UPI002E349099|nr:hypothetical protein [Streptomyces sp. NBC_01262]